MQRSTIEDVITNVLTNIKKQHIEIHKWESTVVADNKGDRDPKTDRVPAKARNATVKLLVDAGGVFPAAGPAGKKTKYILTKKEALHSARLIDKHDKHNRCLGNDDHKNIWKNDLWLAIYGTSPRNVYFMSNAGAIVDKSHETLPCHNCGIVLPHEYIQIDHHMPQAGEEAYYTVKMLRALNYTLKGPGGKKGGAMTKNKLTSALKIHPRENPIGYNAFLWNASEENRWRTNDEGSAFLSIIAHAGKLDDLHGACKNSFVNLVPLCGVCNIRKSNLVKRI